MMRQFIAAADESLPCWRWGSCARDGLCVDDGLAWCVRWWYRVDDTTQLWHTQLVHM